MLSAILHFARLVTHYVLGVALGLLFTLIAVAQFVNDSPASGWLFAFFAALSLLPGAFFAFLKTLRERDAARRECDEAREALNRAPRGGIMISGNAMHDMQAGVVIRPEEDEATRERKRQQAVLGRLHGLYLLSHDGISAGLAAGTEPLPKPWVEGQLARLGETWRRDSYLP
jgi:hypothetical protein